MENLVPGLWYHVWLDGDASRAVVNVRDVAEALPHGSGLDGDWTIVVRRNGDLGLYADYHRMDEYGGYCGWSTLRASIKRVRHDEWHELGTPGFSQLLYKRGDIVLNTISRSDAADWFHECLAENLKAFLSPMGHGSFEQESGRPAKYDGTRWVIA